jgi:predicted DNA-binding transcriptional regulator AlpA
MNSTETLILTESEAARLLGISVSGLRKWRKNATGPKWIKLGRLIRYRSEHVQSWLQAHEIEPDTLSDSSEQ